MSLRIKTIEFATQTVITTLNSATNRDLPGSTLIYIPESAVTFKSVVLYVDCVNDISSNSPASLTSPTISITLGAATISTLTLPNPISQSGEKEAWLFSRNVTSYFQSNWSGTEMTWSVRVNFTGLPTNNHAAKILITYEFDDSLSPNNNIKTIRIPIESTRTLLTTSFQTIGGTNAIPALKGTYLPETGITIRQIFLEMWANSSTNGTTDYTWQTRINGGTPIDTYRHEAAMNSATWSHAIVDITTQTLSSASSLECLVTTTTNRQATVGGMIIATYEFSASASTTIYNSLLLDAIDSSGWIGGTGSTNIIQKDIYIEEPDTISLKESGLCLFQNDSGTYSFYIRCSGNTSEQSNFTQYLNTAGNIQCGTYSMTHRIDSGGQNGSGISLSRGKNIFKAIFYSDVDQAGWNLSSFLILNYTSGKHTNGVDAHAHSVYQHVTDNIISAGSRVNISSLVQPSLPETYYNLIGYVFWNNYNIGSSLDINFTVEVESLSADTKGSGYHLMYNGTSRTDSENMNGWTFSSSMDGFLKWNGDSNPYRLDIKYPRKYKLSSGPLWTGSMGFWYTYNNITYVVSGTCSGYIGDGANISVEIHRLISSLQSEKVLNLTTTTGGVFSGNWIDNTETLYATARQDDTHVGRSKNATAT